MRTSDDFVFFQPIGVDGSQKAQRRHALLRIKYIIYNAFEFKSEMNEEVEKVKLSKQTTTMTSTTTHV